METSSTPKRIAVLVLLLAGLGILGAAGAARADTCTCDLHLYSYDRWMDPWWGLECNEHCGHGYVGSSCDTLHGTGCGAMTGFVRFRYSNGNTIRNLYCPDDHYTCFRGPSGCDDGGSWGNTCSADILHCVSGGNPGTGGEFDCNGLYDPSWVYQLSAYGVRFSGACGTNWFNVYESIDEHDPWCCDDPMGTFNVSSYTAEGYAYNYWYPSYQNCNGGSQGGVYPHCGRFGAALWVDMYCSTTYGTIFSAAVAEGGPVAEQREALAASLARRERKMAETPRAHVVAEVAERAQALGVTAPVEALAGLLIQAGIAELERDHCLVEEGERAPRCREAGRALDRLDAEFRKLSGRWSLAEFRSGSPLVGPVPAPAVPSPRP